MTNHKATTHLYAQTAGLPLLVDGTLSAGSTEHIGAHFAFALQLLDDMKTCGDALEIVAALAHGGVLLCVQEYHEEAMNTCGPHLNSDTR